MTEKENLDVRGETPSSSVKVESEPRVVGSAVVTTIDPASLEEDNPWGEWEETAPSVQR